MAVVYRARDPQLLREVAVKVLHPHLSSDVESRQRFLREAQAAARLRHPNIVEVFDFSVEADRESFMVTELLDGPTLRRFADGRTPLPSEVVAAIGVVLCDALTCAHSMGVVHRDVKPDNILLHKGGVLKLTDFGIAHVADGSGMTVTGQILGSPAHMAPEQIDGGAVDARTDLFSLGTVLYALSVGRLPFDAPVAHALLRKILEADYTDPVRAEPKVGDRFAAIVRRCMARMPDDRYVDAKALRVALCEFCLDAGWDDPVKKLEQFFADPDRFVEAHNAALIELLPAKGKSARDAKKIPEAMGYFNRALALDPSNVKVIELVRSVAKRRQRERLARAAALVTVSALVSAAVVVLAVRSYKRRPPELTSEQNAIAVTVQDAGGVRAERAQDASTAMPTGLVASVSGAIAQDGSTGAGATERARAVPVRLFIRGAAGRLSIDGQEPSEHQNARQYQLAVGEHEVQVVPTDAVCDRPLPWRIDVQPPAGGGVLELTSPTFACRTGVSGPSAVIRSNPSISARTASALIRANNAPPQGVPVRFTMRGLTGLLSIDGRNPREHDNGDEYLLSPGPHTVQMVPADTSCARPPVWRVLVQPTAEGGPLRLTSPRYACVAGDSSSAPGPQ